MPTTATLTAEALEAALDKRPTSELLSGIRHVEESDVTSDWYNSPRYYQFYAGIAALVQPRRIMEIGVRLGYSLTAMFRGHGWIEGISGYDTEQYLKNSNLRAFENLRAVGYNGALDLRLQDSHFAQFPEGAFDLVHVDGDHGFIGALDDIKRSWKALAPGGVMIVDDVNHDNPVRLAVEDALKNEALERLATGFYFDTFRGAWIGVKEAA